MTKTPPPPIWLTGRERHTTPPLQPLCNKATKQTKTISLSVSLIVLVHVDRFHEQMACPTTPSINGIYYFATYYLSSSFSSYYYYIGSTTVESKLFNHKHQNLRFRLRLLFCSSSSCFFYVLCLVRYWFAFRQPRTTQNHYYYYFIRYFETHIFFNPGLSFFFQLCRFVFFVFTRFFVLYRI